MRLVSSLFLPLLATILLNVGIINPTSTVVEASIYDNDQSKNVQVISSMFDFEDTIMDSSSIAMVQFFAPWCGHCQQMAGLYADVANILNGVITIAAVDATTEHGQSLASKYNVEGFPTLLMFGDTKNKPKTYTGNRDHQSLVQGLMDFMVKNVETRARTFVGAQYAGARPDDERFSSSSGSKSGEGGQGVLELTDSTFQKRVLDNPLVSMIAFIAPWCGHCKNLLPDFELAAQKVYGQGAFFGVVDATEQKSLAQQYQIQGFPTIKIFPGGPNKSPSDAIDYTGERTITSMVQAVFNEIDRTGVPKEIPELTSPEILKETCLGSNKLCVLAALPHISDSGADGRNKYRDILSKVQKKFRGSQYSFLWFEGGSQPSMENTLELTFGYPALVAVSMDKGAYAVQRGSFDEKSIGKFLHSVPSGRQSTVKLPTNHGLPESIETVTPWDGKDVEVIEEEFSLEDIMGDEF